MQMSGQEDGKWTLTGVYLLPDPDPDAVGSGAGEGLSLTFLDAGVELAGAGGDTVWACDWSDLAEMSPSGYAELPDGGDALQLLAVERSGRRWHLVVPADDTGTAAASIRSRARSHDVRSAPTTPAVRRSVTIAVAVLAAATLTVLLLSAAHVFTF